MRIIDHYIARRFFANFIILLLLLFIFAISIDLLLELDEFVDVARKRIGPDGSWIAEILALIDVIIDFHGPRIFQFYAYMVGLLSVGAMGFTLAQMHRHRELVAVLASGVRLHRVAMPILVGALGLNLLQLVNQELILPRLAPMLIRNHGDIGRQNVTAFEVPFTVDGNGSLLQAPLFDPDTNTLKLPTVLERDERGRTTRRIMADEGRWNDQEKVWRLVNGRAMIPQLESAGQTTERVVAQPVEEYRTDLTPEVLTMRRYREFSTMLSLRQISHMLGTPGVVDTDALVRFGYARFSTILINMLVLIMTLPYFLLREPASLLRQSMLCAAAAIPATMGALLAFAVDLPGIPAAVEVFLPVTVLLPVAMFMVTTIKT